jgi:WD40 repeat protein
LIKIFNVKTKDCTAILRGHKKSVYDIDCDNDATIIASVSHDKTARLWDRRMNPLKCAGIVKTNHILYEVNYCSFQNLLVCGSNTGVCEFYDIRKINSSKTLTDCVERVSVFPDESPIKGMQFDGTKLVCGGKHGITIFSSDNQVKQRAFSKVEEGMKPIRCITDISTQNNMCLQFDDEILITASSKGYVTITDFTQTSSQKSCLIQ